MADKEESEATRTEDSCGSKSRAVPLQKACPERVTRLKKVKLTLTTLRERRVTKRTRQKVKWQIERVETRLLSSQHLECNLNAVECVVLSQFAGFVGDEHRFEHKRNRESKGENRDEPTKRANNSGRTRNDANRNVTDCL